ncbi:hypothetical protein Tco_1339008 [Tanacetum coccineum]
MYNKKNVDYVALLWEDFMYQADNREISSARKEHMPYPRFTKVIINNFISKDKTISMRNKINLYTICDDSLLGSLKFVSKTQDYQQYGALIPNDMINQDIKDSSACKTYYDFDTGKVPPRKARKYKKVVSPPIKLSHVKEAEPGKKGKRVKRPAKNSTTAPTASVVIRDTPGVSVSNKKAPSKGDKGKDIELLSDAALLEVAQVKEAIQKSKKDSHMLHSSGSGDGVGSQPKVLDESEDKTTGSDEGTDDNDDEGDNDDDDDDASKGDDDKADSDDDGNSDADDNERADSDNDDENPSFTLKDYDEEEHNEDYESDDDYEHMFEEEDDDDLYKDVEVRSLGAESEKERKGDEEMTDADHNVSQEQLYEQVVEDAHVTLTASQKTNDSKQSSSVSLDFANQFIILEKAPPTDLEVASLMNIKMSHEVLSTQISTPLTEPATVIPDSSTIASTTVTLTISMISPLAQLTTPIPAPTTASTITSIPALLIFPPCLVLIKECLPWKRSCLNSKKYATRIALYSYTQDFEKKAQEERKLYKDVVEKSVKDIIKDEVKSLLPQILPKEVLDFSTPMIQSIIMKSLENVVLAKSSSQPKSTYKAVESVTEFELKKILLDKMERTYSLKRDREGKHKDEDPFAGSDRGLKKRKKRKDSSQEEEPVFENTYTKMPQDQGDDMGNTEDQPNVEEASKHDWFKKPERPPTLDADWNVGKQIDFRPPQTSHKPLPLTKVQGHQVVPADYFINNDLEYLKGRSLSRKYITSTTKTYAAKYDTIEGIKNMVQTLWSLVKGAYDKYALWGISKRKIAVTHVKVIKKYDYGYLEEIEVRRDDNTLYKFKEGDFPNLNLRDIEDILLLLVHKKILNLERDVIFDLNVALWIFTRSIVILKRVEDL